MTQLVRASVEGRDHGGDKHLHLGDHGPPSRGGDAVAEARACGRAELTCGPYLYSFTGTRTAAGDLLLGLTPDPLCRDGSCTFLTERDIRDYAPTQLIGWVPNREQSPQEREAEEKRLVRALGAALFDDVARYVRAVSRCR